MGHEDLPFYLERRMGKLYMFCSRCQVLFVRSGNIVNVRVIHTLGLLEGWRCCPRPQRASGWEIHIWVMRSRRSELPHGPHQSQRQTSWRSASPARDRAHDQQAHPSYALLNVTPQCTIILLRRLGRWPATSEPTTMAQESAYEYYLPIDKSVLTHRISNNLDLSY